MLILLVAAALAGEVPVTTKAPSALAPFRDGRAKVLNFQNVEAAALLEKALALDPGFAQAVAYLGKVTPGAEGLALAERAVALAKPLSEPERLVTEILLAERKGEDEKVRNLKRRLADEAPNDWLAQYMLGVQSFYDHKSQATILYLNKAIKLNPRAAEAYNYLGYVLAQQGQFEEGIAACRKFVELKPEEPNSYDAFGEVLLLAGRFDDAEQEFRRSAEMEKDNWMAAVGVAYARFFKSDWKGGREEIERERRQTTRAPDRLAMDLTTAWSFLAEGDAEAALRSVDGIEREALQKKRDYAYALAAFERGEMLSELGRNPDARKQLALALERAAKGKLTGAEQNRIRRQTLVTRALVAARLGDAQDARKALSELEAELAKAPSNADLRGAVHFATGLLALARGEPREAAESFARCPNTDYACEREFASAQEKAGDPGRAEETRLRLLGENVRDNLHHGDDPTYLYVRARVKAAGTTAAR